MKQLKLLLLGLILAHFSSISLAQDYPQKIRIAGGVHVQPDGKLDLGSTLAVIEHQGWLKQQLQQRGIALEYFATAHAATGPMINEGFANGSLDFASYGDLPSLVVNAGGVSTRLLVPNGRGGDAFLVVPLNSTAKTIHDLKGKRIAVHRGRPWELQFIKLLQSEGLEYKDFRILNINPVAGAAAVAAGNIDAFFITSQAYLLEDRQAAKIIWSTKGAPADWKMRTELWGHHDFIERYPELTQLLVTAWVKAAHWQSQEENKPRLLAFNTRDGQPESVFLRSWHDPTLSWRERWSPRFNHYVYSHYRHAIDISVQRRMIRRPLNISELVAPQYVERALTELALTNYWQDLSQPADNNSQLLTD
ncbi:ABC transporter substrate-binding protein [Rheinheimera muenzenbergensis]|uniref:ABC transporter substrate-binding protein n=1 Tax=Rheinheimera muenzenbergensis TaxID=1193628 RepID=A0ABU8C3T5_9GAMM